MADHKTSKVLYYTEHRREQLVVLCIKGKNNTNSHSSDLSLC